MKLKITKEWLISQKIEIDGQNIYHTSYRRGKQLLNHCLQVTNHKYGNSLKYYMICWYNNDERRQYTLLEHRVLYAWYHGEVDEYTDVDHIDGNSLNNSIDNLQAITHEKNIKKREGNGHNNFLYYGLGGLSNREVDELKEECNRINTKCTEDILKRKKLRNLYHHLEDILREEKETYKKNIMGISRYSWAYFDIRREYLIRKESIKKQIEQIKVSIKENVKENLELKNNFKEKMDRLRENEHC